MSSAYTMPSKYHFPRTYNKLLAPVQDVIADEDAAALETKTRQSSKKRAADPFTPLPTSRPTCMAKCEGCRWPVDDAIGSNALFCNAVRPDGAPYCEAHQEMARSRVQVVT
ncbi:MULTISPECIES: GcrA family cell cycle regulator [unclassified Aurantimonas]|uniref:GcrA family cell cycle regulator n=1 Tax=unclassified Aurantimonas TaxID=2638230 RepID=UPI002E17C052|nr:MULTISPECIES: GcrA family cell cycle regulator [unclassified Aurantimonas]MEC5291557.1 GcrA family cell cycle regulator [Aurantimonas sp. C2-3-R2]MEC5412641.1 GcrA family cell cycle regulator [Aurantimonas sp. C2-4-R8]